MFAGDRHWIYSKSLASGAPYRCCSLICLDEIARAVTKCLPSSFLALARFDLQTPYLSTPQPNIETGAFDLFVSPASYVRSINSSYSFLVNFNYLNQWVLRGCSPELCPRHYWRRVRGFPVSATAGSDTIMESENKLPPTLVSFAACVQLGRCSYSDATMTRRARGRMSVSMS